MSKHAKRLFASQGADSEKLEAVTGNLITAGLLHNEIRSPAELATFVIGTCSPEPTAAAEFVAAYGSLTSSHGQRFIDCLKSELLKPVHEIGIQSILISHSQRFASISFLDSKRLDFGEFENGSFQRQVFISGGLLSALAMRIHNI